MPPSAARPGNSNAYKADRWTVEDRGHDTPCWVWQLSKTKHGYGRVMADGRVQPAHRYYFEQARGPVTAGKVLDHLCRVPSCVNPDHLEVVTQRENVMRGSAPTKLNAEKTHCKYGHPFDAENTAYTRDGRRACRACRHRYAAERKAKRHAVIALRAVIDTDSELDGPC